MRRAGDRRLATTRTKKPSKPSAPARGKKKPKASRATRRPAKPSRNGDSHVAEEDAAEDAAPEDDADVVDVESNGEAHDEQHAKPKRRATAQSMAAKQRDISVSEFFAK